MAGPIRLDLGDVQRTLLIPLYGRAVATRAGGRLIDDPLAVAMVEAIDFDFGRLDGAGSLLGATLRTVLIDAWTRAFLAEHPDATVVELGCGLNTRFDRVDNGRLRWYDLDLPDVIALRRAFVTDTHRRRMLPGSLTDPTWTHTVRAAGGPYLLIAEAVLPFLPEQHVREVFATLADRFPGALLVTDTAGARLIEAQHSPDLLGAMPARLQWSCDDPAQPQRWQPNLRLLESVDFAHLPDWLLNRLDPAQQVQMRQSAARNPEVLAASRINRYRLD